ncbi:MAG: copper homeostasis protein CutC [Longimicrobiales bacterium]
MSTPILEVCCASADFALAAAEAGADRVELCDNLIEGGTTPSVGAVAVAAARSGVPVMAMVRPRGGDFLYSGLEFDVMLRDIDVLGSAGVSGLVFGVLDAGGRIDRVRTRRLIEAARPLPVTFHRAFDLSRDLEESLDTLAELGADRILTSVGQASVLDGLDRLAALIERAAGSVVVMPGGGIRPDNIEAVAKVPGVTEIHVGATRRRGSGMTYRREGVPMGAPYEPDEYLVEEADVERIAKVKSCLAKVAYDAPDGRGADA